MSKTITIKAKPLHKWQRDLIDLYDLHPLNSIITVKSPRQRGKTYTLMILALKESINRKNNTTIIICPSFSICRKQFKDFDKALRNVPVVTEINRGHFEIEFKNGSIIKFKSAESRDNLRGETANLLIFDEGAFINLETALECFNYTNTTNGNIVIASTPTFKDESNLFYKYFSAGLNDVKGCYSIDWVDYDTSSMLSNDKLEMYRSTMPHSVFMNEIMGQFLEDKGSVFGEFTRVIRNNVSINGPLIMGVDWSTGTNNDETAIVLFNQSKQMVGLWHFNDKDSIETIDFISNLVNEYTVSKIVIEINSIGKVYGDLLKKKIGHKCSIIDFYTSNSSKREIIQTLQLHIQNQLITLLDEHYLKIQFTSFEVKSTPSGLITYGNCSDRIHDDIVMATALALYGFTKGNYSIR